MADVIKSFIVEYAPFSETAPAVETGWTKIEHSVRSIPNLFPTPDAVDCSVVTDDKASSVAGVEKADAFTFKVAPDLAFLTAHTAMVTDQNDPEKGFFWMRVTYPKRGYTITFKATTVDELATPSGELGALDEVDWPIYPQGARTKAAIATGGA
jgi:hypothetical protein